MTTFDPYEWESFFFGPMERDEAIKILTPSQIGSFLLRESVSRPGGYSLSVRECDSGDHQISHYFIEKRESADGNFRFEMAGQTFVDIPSLITHYQMHILEKSCLIKPIPKQPMCKVIGRYKFEGERVTDLPFERGEILEIIGKPEEGWWCARNSLKNIGLIPVTYVKIYEEGDEISLLNPSTNSSSGGGSVKRFSTISQNSIASDRSYKRFSEDFDTKNKLPQAPAWVRVLIDRYPSIYDEEALPLKQGQTIYLMEVLSSGMCRGKSDLNGKNGLFPFSYVEWTNIPLDSGPWIPNEY